MPIVMDYEVTIHKTDEEFTIGHVCFFPEVLREHKNKKIVKSDAYNESLADFDQAIKEGLVTVRKVERAGDSIDPSALPRGKGGKRYSADQMRKSILADYGMFTRFLREISNSPTALAQAFDIATAEGLVNKARDIDRTLARLNALPRTKREAAAHAAAQKRAQ